MRKKDPRQQKLTNFNSLKNNFIGLFKNREMPKRRIFSQFFGEFCFLLHFFIFCRLQSSFLHFLQSDIYLRPLRYFICSRSGLAYGTLRRIKWRHFQIEINYLRLNTSIPFCVYKFCVEVKKILCIFFILKSEEKLSN